MALNEFLAAVAAASRKFAPQYGLSPQELQVALLTAAGLEGGLGEEAGVGDGGASVGRFQFNMAGGHGSTLLNQGYTKEQIADDAFQANDWAPVIASHLAAVKAAGETGANAVRQAVFNAERPAEMYPQERFNSAFTGAVTTAGAPRAPATGDGSTDGTAGDPWVEKRRKEFRDAADQAIAAYKSNPSQATKDARDSALYDVTAWDEQYPSETGSDAADKRFAQAIQSGNLSLSQATAAYNRWSDKQDKARVAAEGELASVNARNKTNSDIVTQNQESRTWQARGVDSRTYFAPSYEDALAKWQTKYGAGAEPGGPEAYPGPAVPTAAQPGVNEFDTSPSASSLSGWKPGAYGSRDQSTGRDPLNDAPLSDIQSGQVPSVAAPSGNGNFLKRRAGDVRDMAGSRIASSIFPAVSLGATAVTAAKSSGKWWQKLGQGILRHADGTANSPGGLAMMGEKGQETMVLPDGRVVPVGQYGPEVQAIPQGTAVIPNGVPPDEALAYSQIQQAMKRGPSQGSGDSLAEQQARANDPQLREKVIASLKKGMASHNAAHPPWTPTLVGAGWKEDPWANWRPLTGVPPTAEQAQAAPGGQ